jgi:hypothetical protein
LRILSGKLGPDDPRVGQVSGAYADMLAAAGRAEEAGRLRVHPPADQKSPEDPKP